jgi:hypothetical protein
MAIQRNLQMGAFSRRKRRSRFLQQPLEFFAGHRFNAIIFDDTFQAKT